MAQSYLFIAISCISISQYVDVAQPIARKTTVWEDLGSIPCSVDGFSLENIWGWLFLQITISLLSDNGYKCILTYNKKCHLICLLHNCFHWFHFQLIKSTCNLKIWINIYYYYYCVQECLVWHGHNTQIYHSRCWEMLKIYMEAECLQTKWNSHHLGWEKKRQSEAN